MGACSDLWAVARYHCGPCSLTNQEVLKKQYQWRVAMGPSVFIFDLPVTSRFQQYLGRQLARQHEDAHIGFGLAVNHLGRLNAAESCEAKELVVFGKPLRLND